MVWWAGHGCGQARPADHLALHLLQLDALLARGSARCSASSRLEVRSFARCWSVGQAGLTAWLQLWTSDHPFTRPSGGKAAEGCNAWDTNTDKNTY